ncbi:Solute carrier family 22 member 7 [Vulpes lagopus]
MLTAPTSRVQGSKQWIGCAAMSTTEETDTENCWWVGGMRFEELLDQVDGFGPFQLWNVALMVLPRVLLPMHFLLPIFLAAVPAHHCALPGAPANFSHQDAWPTCPRSLMAPSAPASASPTPRPSPTPCFGEWVRALGSWRVSLPQGPALRSRSMTAWSSPPLQQRSGIYIIHLEVNADGGRIWRGGDPFGTSFGQHCLLLVAYMSSLVLGLASTALVSYIMFVITCSITGMALAGFTIIVMLLGETEMEWLDVGHRTEAGVLDSIFWTRDVMRDAVGTGQRWVPESAHWLLTQGHVEEAHRYLLHCSRLNGWPMGEDSLSQEWNPERSGYLRASGTKTVVPRLVPDPTAPTHLTMLHSDVWFGVNFSYYGLSLDVSRLGLDVYQTQLLFGAVEVPSKLSVDLLVRHVEHMWAWCTTLVVIGKSFSETAFTTAYLFTSELYPTVLRSVPDWYCQNGGPLLW